MRDEVRWQPPLRSDEQGCRAACTWKRVGREGSVALGLVEVGVCGGDTAHSVNPAHKSSRGDQRGEARSNTSEEEPRGREDESFGLNENFSKT